MVKNWTVALKLKLKLHLWGTLCLVKSLWFNKKNLQKTLFDSTEIFSIPPKFTAQNLVEKKIIIPYPSLTTFLLVLTFSYYLLSSWTNFCSFNFSFLLSCVNWIPLLINTGDGCTGSQLILTPEMQA